MIRDSILSFSNSKDPLGSVWSPRKKNRNRQKMEKRETPGLSKLKKIVDESSTLESQARLERERERGSLAGRERKSAAVGIWDSVRHVRDLVVVVGQLKPSWSFAESAGPNVCFVVLWLPGSFS